MINKFLNMGDYGFFKVNEKIKNLAFKGLDTNNFLPQTTNESRLYAKNHCSSVLLANLVLYFLKKNKMIELGQKERLLLFLKAHDLLGDGPVLFIKKKTIKLFKSYGMDLKVVRLKGIGEIKSYLEDEKPVALLLESCLLSWHWVIALAWAEDEEGTIFRIYDGWSKTYSYYRPKNSARLWLAMAFILHKE